MTASSYIALWGPQWSTDPRLSSLITAETSVLNAEYFGARLQEAIALRVLHVLTLEKMSGGNPGTGTNSGEQIGAISSKSEGELSISFARPYSSRIGASSDELSATQFGKRFLTLQRQRYLGGFTGMMGASFNP
jgi:hypothetical protein